MWREALELIVAGAGFAAFAVAWFWGGSLLAIGLGLTP